MTRLMLLLVVVGLIGCAATRNTPPKAELRGRILDPEGKGVEGVRIDFDPANDREGIAWGWTTRHDGSYIAFLAPGRYHISLWSFGQPVWDVDLDTIDVAASGARLDYQYRGLRVWGHVRGYRGLLPQGQLNIFGYSDSRAFISASGKLARGAYEVFVPSGRYQVEWELRPPFPTFGSRRSFVVSADTMIDLDVPYEEVRGRVRVRGIESAWNGMVMGTFSGQDTLEVSGRIPTDSHGRYFAYLPAGSYWASVQGGPKSRWIFPRMFSRSVPGPDPVETDLPAVLWTGTVRDSATGAPLDSIGVSVSDSKHVGSMNTETDPRGRFRLLVEAGRNYTLKFWDSYRHRGRLGYQLSNVSASSDTVFNVSVASTH